MNYIGGKRKYIDGVREENIAKKSNLDDDYSHCNSGENKTRSSRYDRSIRRKRICRIGGTRRLKSSGEKRKIGECAESLEEKLNDIQFSFSKLRVDSSKRVRFNPIDEVILLEPKVSEKVITTMEVSNTLTDITSSSPPIYILDSDLQSTMEKEEDANKKILIYQNQIIRLRKYIDENQVGEKTDRWWSSYIN